MMPAHCKRNIFFNFLIKCLESGITTKGLQGMWQLGKGEIYWNKYKSQLYCYLKFAKGFEKWMAREKYFMSKMSFGRITSAVNAKIKASCCAPQHFSSAKNTYFTHTSIFLRVIFIQRRLMVNFQCDCLHQKFTASQMMFLLFRSRKMKGGKMFIFLRRCRNCNLYRMAV